MEALPKAPLNTHITFCFTCFIYKNYKYGFYFMLTSHKIILYPEVFKKQEIDAVGPLP